MSERVVDERAICDAAAIGEDVAIGPFAVVEAEVTLGDGVRIGSHAVVRFGARVGAAASIGAGAIVAAGVQVGTGAVVLDGAVVTRAVPRAAVVEGNPARITGYTGLETGLPMEPVRHELTLQGDSAIVETGVRGVELHRLPAVRDLRGALVAGELEERLPFVARRFFIVHDVPGAEVRGEHAHRECHQFLICVVGQMHVIADDGVRREEFLLDNARTGIYLPPLTWGTQYRYSRDCVLLVLASHSYDAADYIRDYDEFLAVVTAGRTES